MRISVVDEMLPVENVDISGWIKKAEKFIKNATLESFISQVAMVIPLKSYEAAKAELKESSGFLGMGLFPVAIQDRNGQKKRVIPPLFNASNADIAAVVEHKTAQEYASSASVYIESLLKSARQKFDFTEENLEFLVKDNLFVPPEHSASFLKGIVAGFNMDLISAMHLLMPQVEYCIRCLAEECGVVAYKTDRKGIEDCLSLKSIFNLPEIIDCLDETFLFNLRVFFSSKYGFDMRNEVCHGLRSDSELQSADCLAVWWFILRICCTYSNELNRRLAIEEANK